FDRCRVETLPCFDYSPGLRVDLGLLTPPAEPLLVRHGDEIGARFSTELPESFLFVAKSFVRFFLAKSFSRKVGNALPPDPSKGIVDQNPDDPVRRVKLVGNDHVVGRHLIAATLLPLLVIHVGWYVVILVDPAQDVIG